MTEPRERQAFAQWLDGETNPLELANILELSHLAVEERLREVKRFKDRVIKRVTRLVAKRLPAEVAGREPARNIGTKAVAVGTRE